jgi:hypothetical protein
MAEKKRNNQAPPGPQALTCQGITTNDMARSFSLLRKDSENPRCVGSDVNNRHETFHTATNPA